MYIVLYIIYVDSDKVAVPFYRRRGDTSLLFRDKMYSVAICLRNNLEVHFYYHMNSLIYMQTEQNKLWFLC